MSKESMEFHYDVEYEVWRNGGNPDRVSPDQTYLDYENDLTAEQSANKYFRIEYERTHTENF